MFMKRETEYGYLVERSFIFAVNAHEAINQRRKYSGEPYFMHQLAVARIVSKVLKDGDAVLWNKANKALRHGLMLIGKEGVGVMT